MTTNDMLDDDEAAMSRSLGYAISQIARKEPLLAILSVGTTNGFEQWCVLCQREQSGSGIALVAQLCLMFRCRITPGQDMQNHVERLMSMMVQYDTASQELLADRDLDLGVAR